MHHRRTLWSLLVVILVAVLLAACGGGGGDDETGEEEPEKEREEQATTTTVAPPTAPLTGLPDPSGASQDRSALAVKVGNNPQARPQSGLDVADVVFEEVAEGGITRFLAVFNSTAPEQIGPVRSVRRMDPDLASAFGGIFAYSGGTPPNVQAIRNTPGVLSVDETQAGEAMRRDPSRRAPDNLYVLPEKMWEKGGEPVPPPALFAHLGEGEAFEGIPVTSARIGFAGQYAPTWTWDEAAGAWKRSYGDQPFTVQSGDQVTATNVVVQFVEYPRDSEGITVGEGDVWVFADGQVATGRWIRPDRTRPAELRGTDGNPLELVPGRTWVALLPVGSSVDLVTPPPPTTTAGRSTTTDR